MARDSAVDSTDTSCIVVKTSVSVRVRKGLATSGTTAQPIHCIPGHRGAIIATHDWRLEDLDRGRAIVDSKEASGYARLANCDLLSSVPVQGLDVLERGCRQIGAKMGAKMQFKGRQTLISALVELAPC